MKIKHAIVKILAVAMSVVTIFAVFAACVGTPGPDDEPIDNTKSQLRVHSFDGGVGSDWLRELKPKFEEAFAGESFETGKTGVQILITSDQTYYNATTIKTSPINVFFLEAGSSVDLSSSGAALKVTDVVTDTSYGDSIESRMTDRQKGALGYNNDYYVIPHYEFYGGLAYDIDVFDEKKLYMSSTAGQWTNLDGSKSLGPDGKANTSDDGLPATYEEFYALCDRMVRQGVTPFMSSGNSDYANYLLQALFVNYAGADGAYYNVSFDSGEKTTEIVTGFNGDVVVTEEKKITPETGYLLSQQAGKYYALSFLEKVLSSDSWKNETSFASTTTHSEAQEEFILGYLENNPYGFLLDGAYWYNEAVKSGAVGRASAVYDDVESRRFGWMSLPRFVSGTVTEGNQVLADLAYSYCVINGNLAENETVAHIAKEFVKFAYKEDNLQAFTAKTGVMRGLEYKLTDEQVASMSVFNQTMYNLRKDADVVQPVSASEIFVNNQAAFSWNIGKDFWASTINNSEVKYPFTVLKQGSSHKSAKEYFEGMKITQEKWNSSYGKYFD